jgi:ribosomal protein S18 acetylase RimI-like enzyme
MIRHLDWDSEHFGLRIGRMEGDMAGDLGRFDCVYFLAPASDSYCCDRARELGFSFVAERVTLVCEDLTASEPLQSAVRPARTTDLPDLSAIPFPESRFNRDTHFPADRVERLYAQWIESLLDSTLVAECDGATAGYVSLSGTPAARIVLIAVAERFRRTGIGGLLISSAKVWGRAAGFTELTVVTQGENDAALRLYQSAGFRPVSRELWFHWWRTP